MVVYDHGYFSCGFAATVAAGVQERAVDALKCPVLSVTAVDVPMPYSFTLAREIAPSAERLVAASTAV